MATTDSTEMIYVTRLGKYMTLKEFKAMKKQEAFDKLPKYKQQEIIKSRKMAAKARKESQTAIPNEIKRLLNKSFKTMKSLRVFKEHSYRSWGVISYNVTRHPLIEGIYAKYMTDSTPLIDRIEEIKQLCKTNDKSVYQRVLDLSFRLDDVVNNIRNLMQAVRDSGVCTRFKDHEMIYGEGRQLGMRTLMIKAFVAIRELEIAVKRLQGIADDGIDPMQYCETFWGLRK